MSNVLPFTKAPAVHVTLSTCRECRKPMLASIARYFGSDENGYICPDCVIKDWENEHWLSLKLAEEANLETHVVLLPGSPWACVICGSTINEFYRRVPIDGKTGNVCAALVPMATACERKWVELNREKIAPRLQYELKLR